MISELLKHPMVAGIVSDPAVSPAFEKVKDAYHLMMQHQEALLMGCGVLIFIACLGLLRFGERKNIVYARIHIAGVVDAACILAMVILGYPIVALAYLVLTPFAAHSIANAHYVSERGGYPEHMTHNEDDYVGDVI